MNPQEQAPAPTTLHPKLQVYVAALLPDLAAIGAARRTELDALAVYVRRRRDANASIKLTFICTHNSRRSHLAQLWAAVAAAYHGVPGVETFSGGTETTAFNPRAVAALRRAGFEITTADAEAANPRYAVTFSPDGPTMEAFSKTYTASPNPTTGFAAVMTCSEADESCPSVDGAGMRLAIRYVDPKASDGTPDEAATYDARAKQIATEMFYVFAQVAA